MLNSCNQIDAPGVYLTDDIDMTHNSQKKRFEALLQPHFDALYAAARRMTLVPGDAEDLVQEVCIKAYTRMEEFESIDYQRAWLLRVMYNKFIDMKRADSRSPVGLADTGADSVEPGDDMESSWLPDNEVDREIRIVRILSAMRRLDREQAALIALRDIEGLTVTELEELTGMPSGTIKAKLHRGRARLGRLLSNSEWFRPELKAVGGSNEL